MNNLHVCVPIDLLQDEGLTNIDRRLWMVMRLDRRDNTIDNVYQPARLAVRAFVSLATVYNSLQRLSMAGWYTNRDGCPKAIVKRPLAHNGWVDITDEMLANEQLKARDIVVYAWFAWEDRCRRAGQFSYKALGACAGVCVKTARRAIKALTQADWLYTRQKNQKAPIEYKMDIPSDKYCREQIALTKMRLNRPDGHGEAIAQAMVALAVTPAEYIPNARPSWLRNPATLESLEVDLLFKDLKLAVEFHGAQHFRPTDFATAEDVARQQQRDAIKMPILRGKGYTIVVLTAADLSVEAVVAKLQGLAPLRNLRWYEPLVRFLNLVGQRYQRKALLLGAQV